MIKVRSPRAIGTWIAIAVAIAVAAFALMPGSWGTAEGQTAGPPPPTPAPAATPVTVTVPPSGGTVSAPAASVSITLPASATGGQPIVVSVTPLGVGSGSPAQTNAVAQQVLASLGIPAPAGEITDLFQIDASNASSGQVVHNLDGTVTLTVAISPAVLAAAGGNPANVSLQFFDTASGKWTPVSCTASATGLACNVNHFSVWAQVVTSAPIAGAAPTPAAPTSAPVPAATGYGPGASSRAGVSPLWFLGAAVVLGGLGFGGLTVTRKRRA